jgi:hypothetical protein
MKFDPRQRINVLATTGALGDTIATFPTLKLLTERGHIEKLFVDDRYWALYNLFFHQEILVNLRDVTVTIPACDVTPDIPRSVINPETGDASFLDYPTNPNIPMVRTMNPFPTSIHCELVDCFSLALCDAILKPQDKNYPLVDPARLPQNPMLGESSYIVVAYGATTEHRRMLPDALTAIVEHFTRRDISVVLLGKHDHDLHCNGVITRPTFDAIPEGCIDLIDQTTLPEALAVMRASEMVIGLDNGLIHLAALTDVHITAGYTTVDPYYRTPYRHGVKAWNMRVVLPKSDCRFCQTETYATYGLNFLKCQTRTLECQKSLTFDQWKPDTRCWG